MKLKCLMCIFAISLVVGCSSSETSSMADGLEQSDIDKYNAMIEEEAKLAAESGEIGKEE